MKIYFISAIGTDSGKTLTSAILCEALQADYWKPIQAGFPRDTETVQSLVSNHKTVFHAEAFLLQNPESPHSAASKEGISLSLNAIEMPIMHNENLIIEGAGGLLVPLNTHEFMIDMIQKFDAELILVSNLYLGSINHTLLSLSEIKRRNLKLKGIIFNGVENRYAQDLILEYAQVGELLHIYPEKSVTKALVKEYAQKFYTKFYSDK